MINPDDFANKYTAVYRCPDDVKNFKISVTIKEAKSVDFNEVESDTIECKVFSWQQKVYGKFEREFYKDEKNCVTDAEKKCHEDIVNLIDNNESVLFSYTMEDQVTIPEELYESKGAKVTLLSKQIHEMRLTNKESEQRSGEETNEYDFKRSLLNSLQQSSIISSFELMYIAVDLGEYVEDTWLKQEYILCTLKYDKNKKILTLYPDFSQSKPYLLQVQNDCLKNYYYYIENASNEIPTDLCLKENEILNKLITEKARFNSELLGTDFNAPPRSKLWVFFFCEICTATNFEYNNIYIRYFVDLPTSWSCENANTLKGTTHVCKTTNEENLAHFGFHFEFTLQYDLHELDNTKLPQPPYIYFEVVSIDSWSRYRSEGVGYKNLPITKPGSYTYELQCCRLYPQNPVGNLRRFFIGDYSSYDDSTWFGYPRNYEEPVINKFGVNTIGTGQLNVRMNVVHQSPAFVQDGTAGKTSNRQQFIFEKLASSSLIKSVEEVLKAFKKAKKNMLEAKKLV